MRVREIEQANEACLAWILFLTPNYPHEIIARLTDNDRSVQLRAAHAVH